MIYLDCIVTFIFFGSVIAFLLYGHSRRTRDRPIRTWLECPTCPYAVLYFDRRTQPIDAICPHCGNGLREMGRARR